MCFEKSDLHSLEMLKLIWPVSELGWASFHIFSAVGDIAVFHISDDVLLKWLSGFQLLSHVIGLALK